MRPALVIGYGNPFRGDDAAGWIAAHALADDLGDDVQVLIEHQLTPEMAEPISRARRVAFIDASLTGRPGEIHREVLTAADVPAGPLDHQVNPGLLLTYAQVLFGHRPPAAVFSVTAESLAFGEAVSPVVRQAIPRLIQSVEHWLLPAGRGKEAHCA